MIRCSFASLTVQYYINNNQHDGDNVKYVYNEHDRTVQCERPTAPDVLVETMTVAAGHEKPAEANFDKLYNAPQESDEFDAGDQQSWTRQRNVRLVDENNYHAQGKGHFFENLKLKNYY